MRKTLHPPPPQTTVTPTFEMQNQNKGIEDIMDIDSNCLDLLFGETTSHLTSKWRGHFSKKNVNVENSIKREMRKNCFSKKQTSLPPPLKFHHIKNYTAHPHDMVHAPAKFWENTAMWRGGGGDVEISPGPTAPSGDKKETIWTKWGAVQ